MTDYVAMAVDALKRPSDFGYYGREDMFVTWGITGPHMFPNSDSLEDESNFFVFQELAADEFGTDDDEMGPNLDVEYYKHWAYSGVDSIVCKVLKHEVDHDEIEDEDLTDEFKFVCDKLLYIREEYPLLDEEDFSEREYERDYLWFEQNIPCEILQDSEKNSYLADYMCNTLGVDWQYGTVVDEDYYIAAYRLGYEDRDTDGEEWAAWEFLNPSEIDLRYRERWLKSGQLELEV